MRVSSGEISLSQKTPVLGEQGGYEKIGKRDVNIYKLGLKIKKKQASLGLLARWKYCTEIPRAICC